MKKTLYLFGFLLFAGFTAYAQCITFTTIASGPAADHTLGIRDDGTLWAWGSNSSGQLGDGTITDKNTPVQIGAAANWARISAGSLHTLGIKSDGTLWAWGENDSGQLGDNSNNDKNAPVQIGTATNWVSVKAGAFHSLATRSDGSLWAWGINSNGELGNGDNTSRNVPTQITSASDWISISAGFSHSLGIRSDGSLWAWGDNQYGQLGDGSNADKNIPVQVAIGSTWLTVSGGGYHTLGIKSNGTLWAWGRNDKGQLDNDGTFNDKNVPSQNGSSQNYVAISAGMYHSSAITGLPLPFLLTWGANDYWQRGNGVSTNNPINYGVYWASITAGKSHSFGVSRDGQLWAWGNNASGQLGNSSTAIVDAPMRSGCRGNWEAVDGAAYHSLAVKSDGTAWGWGNNEYGQLGTGSNVGKYAPVQIGTESDWVSFSPGAFHSLGLKTNGTLWAWGNNEYGQVGDGSGVYPYILSPVQIGSDSDWSIINANNRYSMAIKTNGTLWAWGEGYDGQLGLGSVTNKRTPTQVGTGTDWASVSTGGYFTLAIKKNGTLWAWGNNSKGKLGDGSNTTRKSPVQIGTDTDWKIVSAGGDHATAIKNNGSLWAWGWNYLGLLGDGTNTDRNTPVRIGTDNDWLSVSAGLRHTVALKTDHTLWTWGKDIRESSANGVYLLSPTKVGTDANWAKVNSEEFYSLGLKMDGTLWAWGKHNFGQPGDGSNIRINMPVQVVSLPNSKLAVISGTTTMQQGQHNMFESNSSLIASVSSETGSPNPVSGAVTAKVWIESTQPAQYVRRHFEIAPAENAGNATGWVTLYFTQEDFNAFNAVNTLDLPSNSADNAGFKNLRIEKRSGVSTNNTGSPGSYPGAPVTFQPEYFAWNAAARWWEVGFKVTGFSGFFLKTSEDALPVRLISFTVQESENNAVLKWETATEEAASHFDVERSTDAVNFEKIGQVKAAGNSNEQQAYTFTDSKFSELGGTIYYRLRMVDTDETFALSRIQALSRPGLIKLYPNPTRSGDILTVEARSPILKVTLHDISGNNIPVRMRLKTGKRAELSVGSLPQGVYIIQVNSGDEVISRKFVVE